MTAGDRVQRHTAKELIQGIAACQHSLAENGIVAGQKIALLFPVGIQFVHGFIGAMAYGAIPVLAPSGATILQLLGLMRKQRIKIALTAVQVPLFIRSILGCFGIKVIVVEDKGSQHTTFEVNPVAPNQAAFITHSSGSTCDFKVIARSHQILTAQHLAIKQSFPPFEGQRDFPLFPNILLHNLAIGVPSILPALPRFQLLNMEADTIIEQLIKEEINTLTGNLYYFRKLYTALKKQGKSISTVKALGIGGSPIPNQFAYALKEVFPDASIYIIYGSTEAEPISMQLVEQGIDQPEKGYLVGSFHPAITWRIVPQYRLIINGQAIDAGEVEVQGEHVVPAVDGWLQTGDIGYVDDAGKLYLTARKGNEQVYNGFQHYQVEHLLQHELGIHPVAAVASDQGFAIYVEQVSSIDKIKEHLAKRITSLAINNVICIPKLPVDTRHYSKIRYTTLKKHAV